MEQNLKDLVEACELIDKFNSVDQGTLPKIVALKLMTYEGELIDLVPRRVVDDIIQSENINDLMSSCECSCGDTDIEEMLKKMDEDEAEE